MNFQMFKLDLEKERNQRSNCQHPLDHWKKQESSRKTSTSASLTMPKSLTVWITTNCGKFWNRWEYQTTLPASWEICMQVKKKQNRIWNNGLVKNWERSTSRLYSVILLYAEYIMWNAGLDDSQAGIKIARRNINNFRYVDDTTLMQKVKRN